jgi:hypothetical protein
MVRWKLPHLGWIKMFLNPQNMVISDVKDIESTRTKAGFILQYAGEQLTTIDISGTTGSAGIEGINILRTIYRSEQEAFDQIAAELERVGPLSEAFQIAQGQIDNFAEAIGSTSGGGIESAIDVALNIFQQPFPTLASLAANIEMYFQGVLYRGYFTAFSVTETGESPGLFDYSLTFIAHSRQGIRRNFMPWHRQPFNPIGAATQGANPLSYGVEEADQGLPFAGTEEFVTRISSTALDIINGRSTSIGGRGDGISLTSENLLEAA